MSLKESLKYIRERRKRELLAAEHLNILLLQGSPEYYELEKRIRSLRLDLLKGGDKQTELDALTVEREAFLKKNGITFEMLHPAPHCAVCQDVGVTADGYCRCVMMQETSSTKPLFSFSDSKFEIFGEERELAEKVYSIMEKYCEKFPAVNKPNVVIVGKCGSGKTYLASAMAEAVNQKGYSSFMTTSFGFINDMLKYHLAPIDEKSDVISPYLECDMLIIDDLGSETKLNNVSEEYLYVVLSERMAKKRCTVVTSNLDYEQILSRYGERIASRLFDKNSSVITSVSNVDLRKG